MRTTLYRHFDKDGVLLYVGISLSALGRLGQHADSSHWFKSIVSLTMEHFESRPEAMAAEVKAIKCEKPVHNKHHNSRIEAKAEEFARDIEYMAVIHTAIGIKPVYQFGDAAKHMNMTTNRLRSLCIASRVKPFTFPDDVKAKPTEFLTGFQVISMLEHMGCNDNQRETKAA